MSMLRDLNPTTAWWSGAKPVLSWTKLRRELRGRDLEKMGGE
jgi:hypothetical protein